jgi:molybdopterin molybdotransferase
VKKQEAPSDNTSSHRLSVSSSLSSLLTVTQAIALIDALPIQQRRIRLPLHQSAGHRLAEDIRADRDYPPFDKSLMDGYAVRSADIATVPASLQVIGESAAGQPASRAISAGEAMAVMTGAPIPPGADAVVPIEQTDSTSFVKSGFRVGILQSTPSGHAIAPRGSDSPQSHLLLPAGTLLRAPQIAVAASVGASAVNVFDRPRCAVLATGNEIIPFDQSPQAAQIRNSNNPMLLALLTRLGCTVRDLGVVRDDPALIAAAIEDGRRDDALFITGGMSMGQYDYVPRILAELGGDLKITKLRIRPGKPFVLAAMPEGRYIFGLPGNPVSAFVCTIRLASRLLTRLAGGQPNSRVFSMPLSEPVGPNGPREFYQPAMIEGDRVRPLAWKGSADIFTLARADALIIRPENAPALAEGELAPLMLLD